MNVVLGVVSGEQFSNHPYVSVFFKSLKKHVDADIVLFCANLSQQKISEYQQQGFIVVRAPELAHLPNINYRRGAYYNWLCSHPEYSNILCVDVKDVVFQDNPFKVNHNNQLWLFSEGILYGVEWFNPHDQGLVQQAFGITQDMTNKHVINSSIQYGSAKLFKSFCALIYNTMITGKKPLGEEYSEQGIINYLYYNLLHKDSDYVLKTPDKDNFCVHGVCREFMNLPPIDGVEPVFIDGIIKNARTNKPYIMIHQWDRRLFYPQVLEYWK
jgi:hypothetical protein